MELISIKRFENENCNQELETEGLMVCLIGSRLTSSLVWNPIEQPLMTPVTPFHRSLTAAVPFHHA
jgi:hypothetical protein